jgi:DNA primase catalytic subunit
MIPRIADGTRRALRLEKFFVVDNVARYPPLTTDEMKTLANRMADEEVARTANVHPGRFTTG